MSNQFTSTKIMVEHVTLSSIKSFEAVRSALQASVPVIDRVAGERDERLRRVLAAAVG
ncbi:hypothetical protein [Methylobacterium sp. GC_Met_2]|nr:hypothetical protein [Methylobacterium sp. GC_Met_2]